METPKLLSASEQLAALIESRLKDLVPVSSGNLKDSIKAHVDEDGNLTDISIDGESYYKYVDEGRLPGSFPPLDAIRDWAKRRGIEEKKAFVIAKTIADKGIVGKDISGQLQKEQGLGDDQAANSLAEAYADDVEAHMARILNDIF